MRFLMILQTKILAQRGLVSKPMPLLVSGGARFGIWAIWPWSQHISLSKGYRTISKQMKKTSQNMWHCGKPEITSWFYKLPGTNHNRMRIRMVLVFPTARKKWSNDFKILKKRNSQPRILHLVKLSIKYENRIKTFSDFFFLTAIFITPFSCPSSIFPSHHFT